MTRGRRTKPRDLLVADSAVMRGVVDAVEESAACDGPVLVQGEVGSGRELLARVIHYESARRSGTFVPVEAGAAPKELFVCLIESGSGDAVSMAEGGTLLIKEVCELSRGAQRRLGRILRERSQGSSKSSLDVRILATSDPDLATAAEADLFRRTLYERLAMTTIRIPPLRDRTDDIPLLADEIVDRYARDLGRDRVALSTRACERLAIYPWPGNVAELKIICRRLVVRCRGGRIEAGDVDSVLPVIAERVPLESLPFEDMVRSKLATFLRRVEGYGISGFYDEVVARVEKPLLDLVMEHTGGNQVRAADLLGLNRNTLRRKLGEHGIRARTRAATTTRRRRRSRPRDAG